MMILAVSDIAREVDRAFTIIGGMCLMMLILITLAMLYFLVKYRRSAAKRTAQIHGHTVLEATWIILPTILVMYMFVVGLKGFRMMRDVPEGAKVIHVTGQQWNWNFYYPEEDISTVNELVLPGGRAVKFELSSRLDDVLHSFYLPEFRVKEDCVPGMDTYLWIKADMPAPDEVDTYTIFCAEFCGRDHAKMMGRLRVMEPEAYKAWVAEVIADINKPVVMEVALDPESDDIVDRGGLIDAANTIYMTNCLACHGPNGRGQADTGEKDARDFTNLQDWKQGTKVTEIWRTISQGVPGTNMRSFSHLPAWDRFALAHVVASFYEGADRVADTPEEIEKLKVDFQLDKAYEPRETIPVEEAMQAIAAEAVSAKP